MVIMITRNTMQVFIFFKGRFTIAAKQHMAIAEIYEGSVIDLEKVYTGTISLCCGNAWNIKCSQLSILQCFNKWSISSHVTSINTLGNLSL